MKTEKNKERSKELQPEISINPMHQAIIDEYFGNGFNMVRAVLKVRPEISYKNADRLGALIINKKENKPYIRSKHNDLSISAGISTDQILLELKYKAFADVTEFIGLSLEEIKELPPAVRRTLKKVNQKTRTYRYKDGSESVDVTMSYELNDPLQSLEKLAKYVGLYEADNRQKANNINVLNLLQQSDPAALYSLLNTIEQINE